jgi:hypothetical protein
MERGRHWLAPLLFVLMPSTLLAEQGKAKYSVKEHTSYDLAAAQVEKLHAEFHGADYVIDHETWSKYMRIDVVDTIDLDRDGYQDVLVGLHTGGNCCPPDYAVVSHRGDAFFTVYAEHIVPSWNPPEVIAVGEELRIEFLTVSGGAENTSMDEVREQYALRDGQLTLARQLHNSAMLYTERQITSLDLIETDKNSAELAVNLDGDEQEDAIICEYWARWGSMQCIAISSQYPGNIRLRRGCKRVGVLASRTNGMFDLACGRNGRLVFNGVNYVEAR